MRGSNIINLSAEGVEKREKMREIQTNGSYATAGLVGVSVFAYATKLKAGLVPSLLLGVISGKSFDSRAITTSLQHHIVTTLNTCKQLWYQYKW